MTWSPPSPEERVEPGMPRGWSQARPEHPSHGPFHGERHETAKENISIFTCLLVAAIVAVLIDKLL